MKATFVRKTELLWSEMIRDLPRDQSLDSIVRFLCQSYSYKNSSNKTITIITLSLTLTIFIFLRRYRFRRKTKPSCRQNLQY